MAPDKLRPGVEAAVKLWKSGDINKWEEVLNSYQNCCEFTQKNLKKAQLNLSKSSFVEDDKWKEESLLKLIKTKRVITSSQLERLMVWKLRRGQFRPTLMGLIRRNSSQTVEEVTSKAITLAMESPKNVAQAFKILEGLKGVGPATASLILSIILPDIVPFMSDEAMDASIGLPRSYTTSRYEKYQKELCKKAKELGDGWSVELVEKTLFSAAVLKRQDGQ